MKSKIRATLVVHGPDTMSKKELLAVAAWLRRQAYTVSRQKLSRRYKATVTW